MGITPHHVRGKAVFSPLGGVFPNIFNAYNRNMPKGATPTGKETIARKGDGNDGYSAFLEIYQDTF